MSETRRPHRWISTGMVDEPSGRNVQWSCAHCMARRTEEPGRRPPDFGASGCTGSKEVPEPAPVASPFATLQLALQIRCGQRFCNDCRFSTYECRLWPGKRRQEYENPVGREVRYFRLPECLTAAGAALKEG